MSKAVRDEIDRCARAMLVERLARVTAPQRALFERVYPGGPRSDQLVNAIDLCDRTIRKNEADPSRLSGSAPEERK